MEQKAQVNASNKEKSWKLSLQQQKPRSYTHNQLCNLSPYRASEPTTKGSLIRGRCSFSSCRLCGLLSKGAGRGQSLSCSVAPQRVQLHAECNPRTWLHWIHAGDLVKTTAERHQDRVPSCPWLRWGQEQFQHYIRRACRTHERGHQSTPWGEHSYRSNT